MKKILLLMSAAAAMFTMCSCGSLTQRVGGSSLTPQNLEFAKHMREEPSWSNMTYTYNGETHETDKWYSRVMPFIIFWNWTTLGSFEKDQVFAVRKVAIFFPAFYMIDDSRYNAQGVRQESGLEWNLALVLGYENFHRYDTDSWKTGVVWIPGVGPCIGFGPSYFQFLWIPFSDL